MHAQLQRPGTTIQDDFTIGRCDCCKTLLSPDAAVCSSCHSAEISRTSTGGNGSIVSWTVVEVFASRTSNDCVPHTIAIVALDEGPWTYAWIAGAPDANGKAPIRVRYHHMIPGEPYPMFVLQQTR
ncbi:Zn-ribbon domain-containing OB-fold protein [Rhodococcus spongiicola]|uniref:OB-fold domain-containing protein n=1 Tax=Rhodococcus spongiicola TaxID=2487352 RepID=A0A3S3ZHQ4_9NOCA|nr:OB-fold domain-containing protein [Rhodococcus spongiicola]RVW01044.1 OB-fold domain-containing protein [Rhodococcus spongiicola]